MVTAYDLAFRSVLELETACRDKKTYFESLDQTSKRTEPSEQTLASSKLERLASAARISVAMQGIQLEAALAQIYALIDYTAEIGVGGILKQNGFETREIGVCGFHAIKNISNHLKEQIPTLYARLEKKYKLDAIP